MKKVQELILFILVLAQNGLSSGQEEEEEYELSPLDGWFNNLVHPDWGAIDGQLIRRSHARYMDGVFEPAGQNRPNPFKLSEVAHKGQAGLGSARKRTAMLVFFGQQIVEEILDSQRPGCPREFFNIPVPRDHPFNPERKDDLQMPFLRTRFDQRTGQSPNNPRQQLNEITPYFDGTLFYGPGKTWTDAIREFRKGWLKPDDPNKPISEQFPFPNDIRLPYANPPPPLQHYLMPVKRFFRLGNPRGFENPFLLSFGVLWFRYHNLVANQLAERHPDWNDEELFNAAKKKVIAVHQSIVMYQWLPRWLQIDSGLTTFFKIPEYYQNSSAACGEYSKFDGYDSEIHPGITQEFQAAAMRFGHTLVTPGLWIRGPSTPGDPCPWKTLQIQVPDQPNLVHGIRLCNAYWNSQDTVEPMMEDIIRGMASTLAEKEDNILVPDLIDHLFGPLEFSRRDLAAINIQRGRDHGIADYNTVRQAYGLPRKTEWTSLNANPELQRVALALRDLYGNSSLNNTGPFDLDIFVGGMLETTEDGPGELFKKILLDQFLRIRHADRFWFENKDPRQFPDTEIEEIRRITLKEIIVNVTNIDPADIQDDVFINDHTSSITRPCAQPFQLIADSNVTFRGQQAIELCTPLQHYDYFSGSEISYILSFSLLALCVPGTIGVMWLMAWHRQKKIQEARKRRTPHKPTDNPNIFQAVEWLGPNAGERNVKVEFDRERKKIHVTDMRKKPLRMIDLRQCSDKNVQFHFRLSTDGENNVMSARLKGEVDLVLRFVDSEERGKFQKNFEKFLQSLGIKREIHEFSEKSIFQNAETKEERQKVLDMFFRVICLQAFNKTPGEMNLESASAEDVNRIATIELTRTEFAESLGLKPNSIFVRNMFLLFDTDKNGFIGFQEFLDMFVVLASGDAENKARLIFNMYDLRHRGMLTKDEFRKMIKSLLDLSESTMDSTDLDRLVNTMYGIAQLRPNDEMDFEAFKKIFASEEYEETLQKATLGIETLGKDGQSNMSNQEKRKSHFLKSYRYFLCRILPCLPIEGNKIVGPLSLESLLYIALSLMGTNMYLRGHTKISNRVNVRTESKMLPQTKLKQHLYEITRYIENNRLQIFWLTLYVLVTAGIFIERAYYYSFEREHAGLRRIAGYGVTVTRGAASVMMFTYSSLLVTMSRNTITFLRETFFHRFIPFDSAHDFHKVIAIIALIFTVVHCIGHSINLYHICTQSSTDLNCIFREYFRATDVLASFHYWAYGTLTGFSGILLTIIVIVMYVFALPYARRNLFKAFWFTHSWYILLYILTVMHGSARLVQPPLFQFFFIGPAVIYVFDKIVSFGRKKVELAVYSAELLPSDVTALKFKRPIDFDYKSGQWIRIACTKLGESEYHPFTLTSAPHEDFLSLHIRAVGPWTTNLRRVYDSNRADADTFVPPKVLVDGPFGEGHQDWYKYPVAVLVGGGIGVTPFASILKDIVNRSANNVRFPCSKVYFLWVTRTQKQFEWLTDIIQEVENNDTADLVSVHIFVTQFQQKYDLRTTMLYICERHFQKIAGKSLFTGLKAITHFGRPKFQDFLESLHGEHPQAKQIGVFSCGPPPMTLGVNNACIAANKNEGFPTYHHHYENF